MTTFLIILAAVGVLRLLLQLIPHRKPSRRGRGYFAWGAAYGLMRRRR